MYFYEGCIGAIGVLKDWLTRAVSAALDEGQDTLTLDYLQDHILPMDILRQIALDASEGEQKLEHTESNREHLWRILQGGELIAPIPPLPPRETELPTSGLPLLPRRSLKRAMGLRLLGKLLHSLMQSSRRSKRQGHARR